MKTIIGYLLILALGDVVVAAWLRYWGTGLPQSLQLVLTCACLGGVGGALYCLRGVYLNACVRKQWDTSWYPWYFIRPLVSHICGAVSYIFLKAGLLLLEAKSSETSSDLGFFALAIIAGLNVDKFVSKVEDIAQATWGIERSRTAKSADDNAS